ncbi:hypothetical protein [Sphingobium sp.]|uniref:hypothetical protein n=1 Tax=Sphingobium sp. TaxID=1912891 RepID=UPI002B5A78F2|nr:hypothetical protein [Sphingobium sp.]HUD93095.1 hypothetical protein [Sphingobium sp.]
MRTLLSLGLVCACATASASIPVGKKHGPWHVSSISSLSGAGGNDASVSLTQDNEENSFEVRWIDGGPVTVSISIDKCEHEYEDQYEDFSVSYAVTTKRWLEMSDGEVQGRLRADAKAWIDERQFVCTMPSTFKVDLKGLEAAVNDFNDRLRYFAKVSSPQGDR